MCVCSECEVLFGSVAAFDKHIVRPRGRPKKGEGSVGVHDLSRLVQNSKGVYVTAVGKEYYAAE